MKRYPYLLQICENMTCYINNNGVYCVISDSCDFQTKVHNKEQQPQRLPTHLRHVNSPKLSVARDVDLWGDLIIFDSKICHTCAKSDISFHEFLVFRRRLVKKATPKEATHPPKICY